MPTYQNRSSDLITIGNISISPGRKLITEDQYLNLTNHPLVFKLNDEPPLRNRFIEIFTNVNQKTPMSNFFDYCHSIIISIQDGAIPTLLNDAFVEVTAFVSITDLIKDLIPIKKFKFVRTQYLDSDGNALFLWNCDIRNKLDPQLIDVNYEMVTFSITDINIGDGNVNCLIKYY